MSNSDKILLVNPPAPFLIDQRVFANLGLVQLATSLRARGANVEILDLCGNNNPEEAIREVAHGFEIYGFSSTTPQFLETNKLFKALKRENPKARTLIGGAHPSAMYALRQGEDPNLGAINKFDHIIVGEGENLELSSLKPGWQNAGFVKDIDKSPIPDRSLVDIKSYKYLLHGQEATTLVTQRGCPFKCSFCSGRSIDMYKKARSKSPQKVLEELDYLNREFGYSAFMWFDDEVNVNPSRLVEIAKLLQKRDYSHRGFVRSDLLVKHPETLDALVDAGFVELCSGVESGSDEVLKRINKGTTTAQNSQAAEMIIERGLKYKSFTILGHPGETHIEVEKTIQWLKEAKPHGFDVSILSPYPGSVIYDSSQPSTKYPGFDREFNGLYFRQIDYSCEESFFKGKPGEYVCNVRTDDLSSKDILRMRDKMETEVKEVIRK